MQILEAYKNWEGRKHGPHKEEIPILLSIEPGLLQNETKLDFEWKCNSFEEDTININLNFSNPLSISMGKTRDILKVQILDRNKFVSIETNYSLEVTKTLSVIIKPQIDLNDTQSL